MKIHALTLLGALALIACDKADDAADKTAEAPKTEAADTKADAKTDEAKADDAKADEADKAEKKDAHDEFANLSPDEVEKLIADKGCVPVDANNADTRKEYGSLPGAVLLTSYSEFEDSELPEDKSAKLVFYCGSERCSAAPKAAKVAQAKGYTDVTVMRAGIRGWVDAGKDVDKPAS